VRFSAPLQFRPAGDHVGDCEVLICIRTQANGLFWPGIMLRADPYTSGTGYAFVLRSDRVHVRRDGFEDTIMTTSIVFDDTWTWIRARAEGEVLSVKAWLDGEDEPLAWGNSTAHTGSTAGIVGLGYNLSGTSHGVDHIDVKHFSLGTNGDPAPTAPVTDPPTAPAYDPAHFWLSAGDDMSTEVDLTWWRYTDEAALQGDLQYRIRGTGSWETVTPQDWPHLHTGDGTLYDDRTMYRVALTGLNPGTEYELRFHGDGEVFYFRTLPADLSQPVIGIATGDPQSAGLWNSGLDQLPRVSRLMRDQEPSFVMVVGDWTLYDGKPDLLYLWDVHWEIMAHSLYGTDGRLPIHVPVVGNHDGWPFFGGEKTGHYDQFYDYFRFPHNGGWREYRASDWLWIGALDSEHSTGEISGSHPQIAWLQSALDASDGIKHRLVASHRVGHSARSDDTWDNPQMVRFRQHVHPILNDNGIRLAFCGDGHMYSRSVRIGEGYDAVADHDTGVKYFGEGAWARGLRPIKVPRPWYVEDSYGRNEGDRGRTFHLLTIHNDGIMVGAVDATGDLFHTHVEGEPLGPIDPDPPTPSGLVFAPAPSEPLTFAPAGALDEPEVNAPPVFQTSPPTTVRAGQTYVYNGVVTDADGDPITITLEEGPDWLELTDHGDGTFTLEGTAPSE